MSSARAIRNNSNRVGFVCVFVFFATAINQRLKCHESKKKAQKTDEK